MKNWQFILGIDVSKNTLDVYCWEKSEHLCIENGKKGFTTLKAWSHKNNIDLSTSLVVLEFTGGYEHKFLEFCEDISMAYARLPGLQIKRSMGIVRGKTDKVDSKRIAQYGHEKRDSLEPSKPLNKKILELKSLLRFRKRLVRERAGYETTVREREHMYSKHSHDMIIIESKKRIKELKAAQTRIEAQITGLIESDSELKRNFILITSIKGIGSVNGWMTIAYTENFTCFSNARSYAVYVGVIPFDNSSGISIRGKKRVSQLAHKELKSEMSMAARTAMIWDKELKAYADRKLVNKPWGLVVNNVKFKLILRMYAVVKKGTKYVENYQRAA